MSRREIPVVLITGYLGSGKTTLMQHLLSQEKRKVAVIVNDMGSINIDASLLNAQKYDMWYPVMRVVSYTKVDAPENELIEKI